MYLIWTQFLISTLLFVHAWVTLWRWKYLSCLPKVLLFNMSQLWDVRYQVLAKWRSDERAFCCGKKWSTSVMKNFNWNRSLSADLLMEKLQCLLFYKLQPFLTVGCCFCRYVWWKLLRHFWLFQNCNCLSRKNFPNCCFLFCIKFL